MTESDRFEQLQANIDRNWEETRLYIRESGLRFERFMQRMDRRIARLEEETRQNTEATRENRQAIRAMTDAIWRMLDRWGDDPTPTS